MTYYCSLWCYLYQATPVPHPLQIHFSEYVLNIKIYFETYFIFNNNLFQMPMIAFIITRKFPLAGRFLGYEDEVQNSLVLHPIGCFMPVASGYHLSERIRRGLKSVWIPEELIYHVGHMSL